MMIFQLIQFCALFFLMLVTGIFWGPWFSLHRSLSVFNSSEFIHIVKTMAANLSVPMRILMPLCIFFLAVSAWFYPSANATGLYFNLMALVLTLAALLITILIEVPIVNQILKWTVDNVPAEWEHVRDKWLRFHVVRTFLSLASFAFLTLSILSTIV